jgi:hypothetical protein
MVAAGLGWAMTTPLCLCDVPPPEDKIRCAPPPAPGLSRHLTLVARSGERGSIPAKVASLACRVIEARLRPERRGLCHSPRSGSSSGDAQASRERRHHHKRDRAQRRMITAIKLANQSGAWPAEAIKHAIESVANLAPFLFWDYRFVIKLPAGWGLN